MKHTFIILSLLLLTSPLFGQETGVLYQYETSSGIQWKTFGDGKVQPKYKGEIKNGKPNGQGIYTYPDDRKYIGQWKDGKINGRGTYTSPFRWKYVGEFKELEYNGQGTITYSNGTNYVGEFKNGIQNGQGTNTFSNGWNGIGEWIDVEPWNIKVFDKKGNLKMKWENGKQIKL